MIDGFIRVEQSPKGRYVLVFQELEPTEFYDNELPQRYKKVFDDRDAAEAWRRSPEADRYYTVDRYPAEPAPPAHLTDAQLADQLGEALLTLDAPVEEPVTGEDDDPLGRLRNLVAEADERLADIDGEDEGIRRTVAALDSAMLTVLFSLTDGRKRWIVLAELQDRAANANTVLDEAREAYGSMPDRDLQNFRKYYAARDGWLSGQRVRLIIAEQERRATR